MIDLLIAKLKGLMNFVAIAVFSFGALFLRYLILPFQDEMKRYEALRFSWKFFLDFMQAYKTFKYSDKTLKTFEKLKDIKGSIIVSTHPSFIDVVILMSVIPKSTCFVAEKLTRNPFLKGIVEYLFIPEGLETDIWVEKACKMLEKGVNVIIFPMGGRHRKDEHPKIRRGASLLALKSKKNIHVLNIETSYPYLGKHQRLDDVKSEPAIYDIEYLEEIDTKDFIEKFPDSVTFKSEITKYISKLLYN